MSNYVLQHGFNKKTKGREISTVLRYWWTGLGESVKQKKNWFIHMLCRQSLPCKALDPVLSLGCESQAPSPKLHQDIVSTGCWARPALCWTIPGNPKPSRFLPILPCPAEPAGLWLPSLRLTPGSCLGLWPHRAFLPGKLAAHLLLGLSPPTASTGWRQQYLNSTGGTGQSCLAGDTRCSLCHLCSWRVVTQQSGVRGQKGYKSEPSVYSLYPWLFSGWNLSPTTVSLVPSQTLSHKANTCTVHADTLGSQGSTVHPKIGKPSLAKNLDRLHKQIHWQEFSPTFFLSFLLKKLSY